MVEVFFCSIIDIMGHNKLTEYYCMSQQFFKTTWLLSLIYQAFLPAPALLPALKVIAHVIIFIKISSLTLKIF